MIIENKTEGELFEEILNRMLQSAELEKFDKRESGMVYNMLAPVALELAGAYILLNRMSENSYVDSADFESLKKKARERGIIYKEANPATVKAEIISESTVEVGEKFLCNDLSYSVTSYNGDNIYELECETGGECGNISNGKLVYLGYLNNISYAEIVGIIKYGNEPETAEELRARYYESVNSEPYAGNKAYYKSIVGEYPGVGGCMVLRPNSASVSGLVKIYITDTKYGCVDYSLLEAVENKFYSYGDGTGMVPICHRVEIFSVTEFPLVLSVKLELQSDADIDSVTTDVLNSVEEYRINECKKWAAEGKCSLRKSRIFSEILKIKGVEDIEEISLKDINGTEYGYIEFNGVELPKINVEVE